MAPPAPTTTPRPQVRRLNRLVLVIAAAILLATLLASLSFVAPVPRPAMPRFRPGPLAGAAGAAASARLRSAGDEPGFLSHPPDTGAEVAAEEAALRALLAREARGAPGSVPPALQQGPEAGSPGGGGPPWAGRAAGRAGSPWTGAAPGSPGAAEHDAGLAAGSLASPAGSADPANPANRLANDTASPRRESFLRALTSPLVPATAHPWAAGRNVPAPPPALAAGGAPSPAAPASWTALPDSAPPARLLAEAGLARLDSTPEPAEPPASLPGAGNRLPPRPGALTELSPWPAFQSPAPAPLSPPGGAPGALAAGGPASRSLVTSPGAADGDNLRAARPDPDPDPDPEPAAGPRDLPRTATSRSRRSRAAGVPPAGAGSRAATTLPAGTLIPALLLSEVDSQLPGALLAQVSRDVYDARMERVVIPGGSRLLGRYDNQVAAGGNRLLVAWTRLTLPGGTVLQLPGLPATTPSGASGVAGRTDNHLASAFGDAVLLSLLGAGAQLSQPQPAGGVLAGASPRQVAAAALGEELSRVAVELVRRDLAIPPTLHLPPATPFDVFLNHDLVLPVAAAEAQWPRR